MLFLLEHISYKNILHIDTLAIPEKKVTCITGESGSGKTTLLRMLNDMVSPDKGSITYKGVPVKDIPAVELRRRVVMLPQTPVIFPGNTEHNLQIGIQFAQKVSAKNEDLEKVLRLVQLQKTLEDDPERFSGGEKQRLALARILLMKPEVLLLDEPSSALDEETAHMVMANLVEWSQEEKAALVMVTHSMSIARQYGEMRVTLSKGSIVSVEEGRTGDE